MDARAWTLTIIFCKFLSGEGGVVGGRALISSWKAWRVASTWLMLVSSLILLLGDLVCPQIHLRNRCTCWYRCSVEDLANYR